MVLINDYISLITGLVLLLLAGDFLVKGAVSLADHFRISRMVVGITVVSFGTSAPELFVSTSAALSGHPDISIGNVVGSNISNIALVLALTALIFPIPVKTRSLFRNWVLLMVVSVLLFVFSITEDNSLRFYEGFIFMAILIGFIISSVRTSRKEGRMSEQDIPPIHFPLWIAVLIILISCSGLVLGSNWLVGGASGIARDFGISERVISLSVIALGTSLPELATSAMAALRKEMDISIGNILGSNLFNTLAILGITAMITPVSVNADIIRFDYFWMIGISGLLLLSVLPLKGGVLKRWKAVILIALYVVYLVLIFS